MHYFKNQFKNNALQRKTEYKLLHDIVVINH